MRVSFGNLCRNQSLLHPFKIVNLAPLNLFSNGKLLAAEDKGISGLVTVMVMVLT